MKILLVSIFSSHFFNWTEQLREAGHEIYWFDVNGSGEYVKQIDFVHQHTSWRYRWDFPGRYFLKENFSSLYKLVSFFNERSTKRELFKTIAEVEPDLVHSFVTYLAGKQVMEIIDKTPPFIWAHSTWGSDLFYYSGQPSYLNDIRRILPKVDFLFTDCERDFFLAKQYGFKNNFLGVFPGRGGFDFQRRDSILRETPKERKIIIKGYQGKHGKCIEVLKAFGLISTELKNWEVIVFGASKEVVEFVNHNNLDYPIKVHTLISHEKVLRLMATAEIYIGNSSSDGIPNTLLEAIIMNAFPVQSNPGGATSELIVHEQNGLIIKDPEDIDEISQIFRLALNEKLRREATKYNEKNIAPFLEYKYVKEKVLDAYSVVENQLRQ